MAPGNSIDGITQLPPNEIPPKIKLINEMLAIVIVETSKELNNLYEINAIERKIINVDIRKRAKKTYSSFTISPRCAMMLA